jgi:hypothetical protein
MEFSPVWLPAGLTVILKPPQMIMHTNQTEDMGAINSWCLDVLFSNETQPKWRSWEGHCADAVDDLQTLARSTNRFHTSCWCYMIVSDAFGTMFAVFLRCAGERFHIDWFLLYWLIVISTGHEGYKFLVNQVLHVAQAAASLKPDHTIGFVYVLMNLC